ncbi:fatty acid desaturase family protein [Compostimonas suwonensis]|uniref:Fatty acid desaturase n=1 Tax=Compostimonas suwonensis TaxID=1048394 RepID=A0A2M9BWQ9_9MICO|nr:acyl-CoA desaturase [Compostimonas suwonensis]PJJ62365.1 fatty acid desaturase [Compostimonas suwonensis]
MTINSARSAAVTVAGSDPARSGTARAASDFTELARQIQAAGLMRRRYGYYWSRLLAVPVAYAACFALFVWIGNSWWQLFVAVLFAVLFTQTAFLGHDAAHRQIFRSGRWNDWISLVVGDLFIGMSYGWWQHKHTRHHANPNQLESDPDLELPVISFTPEQAARRRGGVVGWLMAHQGAFFFPILLLEGLSLHASSVRRVVSREHVSRRWVEIGFLTVRLGGYLLLVFLVLTPDKAFLFLGVQLGLFGFYMGVSFAPNHKGMPIVPKALRLDFLRRQVMMSRDIRGSKALDVAMGGLNYQIEHHLFPSMPRPHLRRAAPMISAYCRDHDVPYTQTGLWQSYAIVLRYINRVGLGERDPFDCPLVQQRQTV